MEKLKTINEITPPISIPNKFRAVSALFTMAKSILDLSSGNDSLSSILRNIIPITRNKIEITLGRKAMLPGIFLRYLK
jgi:hypothetical protein